MAKSTDMASILLTVPATLAEASQPYTVSPMVPGVPCQVTNRAMLPRMNDVMHMHYPVVGGMSDRRGLTRCGYTRLTSGMSSAAEEVASFTYFKGKFRVHPRR